jgi:protein gp37
MAEKTEISWADSTFNPVIGCQKVSAGCDRCYAETLMDTRYKRVAWGQRKTDDAAPSVGTRVRTSAANWRQPVRWNARAAEFKAEHGHRQRVFCASLSDVFDNQWEPAWRADLFNLIKATPELDWLLLTKRPENIIKMLNDVIGYNGWGYWPWPNVWLGTTCEDQDAFDHRWPIMLEIPARVRFVSYEPAIGPLTMEGHAVKPDWVICGGESGPGHRDMPAIWAENVMEECEAYAVAFYMKQMAGRRPIPEDLLVRQFPS